MTVLGLPPAGSVVGGSIEYGGTDLLRLSARQHNALRGDQL
ncbi:ABC transporter ATP-binding protein, partial [Kineosporiaceae bacterium B12]|nr:ABC transporter ATP-binding protein [Kineococcus rubinsiae]